jgi:uncharacterized protein YjbJ (UPF0337 family)
MSKAHQSLLTVGYLPCSEILRVLRIGYLDFLKNFGLRFQKEFSALVRRKVMGWDRIEGNWDQTKGKIRGKWSKLTADDLDAINGHRDLLESVIQQRYGFAPDYVRKEVDNWFRWQDWRSPSFTTSMLR